MRPSLRRMEVVSSTLLAAAALSLALAVLVVRGLRAPLSGGRVTTCSFNTSLGTLVVRSRSGTLDPIRRRYRAMRAPRRWGLEGSGAGPHRSVYVWDMEISLGDRSTVVPPEALLDLVDLRLESAGARDREILVRFRGADAGSAYEGFFAVHADPNHLRVVRREIWPGEFPESARDVLHFSEPP